MPSQHHIVRARANVGVGLTCLLIGQSNTVSNLVGFQASSHPNLRSYVYRQDMLWREANDPGVHTFSVTTGSPWPHLATLLMAALNAPVGYISCGVGGTGLAPPTPVEWAPGGEQYLNTIRQVRASGIDKIELILWHQGEQDASAGVPQAVYQAAEVAMLAGFRADVPALANARLVSALLGQYASAPTRSQLNAIRLAKLDNWDNHGPDILPGPSIIDFDLLANGGDGLHVKTVAHGLALSERWARLLLFHLGVGSEGRGPRVSSVVKSSPTTVAVTFTGGVGALQNGTVTAGFRVEDAAGVRTVVSAAEAGGVVTLTLDQSLTGSVLASFGSFNDAAADVTLRDSGMYPLPPEPFVDVVAV